MRDFHCICGARIFFENTRCLACGRALGFDPYRLRLTALEPVDEGLGWVDAADSSTAYRSCRNRAQHCTWLVHSEHDGAAEYCLSCRLTGTLPNLSLAENHTLWARLEAAKRRLLYDLLSLGLPVSGGSLRFDFLQDKRTNPLVREMHVYTGHKDGVITINVAEADDPTREAIRKSMGEEYRTLLGHMRHESGHYYWSIVVTDEDARRECRVLFGDERTDYESALQAHHEEGPTADWQDRYITAYASSHPQEDWAECWAHFLHIADTMETARVCGLLPAGSGVQADDWLERWTEVVISVNELNRSLGLKDAYPFLLNAPTRDKLEFIRRRVGCSPAPP